MECWDTRDTILLAQETGSCDQLHRVLWALGKEVVRAHLLQLGCLLALASQRIPYEPAFSMPNRTSKRCKNLHQAIAAM